ncbi:MAG: phosphodiester glycosidase family protein [Calditrichaeota bacterium]|nr:MAG: phosphodiester glycosidase family protein [Calditrichota bacterium]
MPKKFFAITVLVFVTVLSGCEKKQSYLDQLTDSAADSLNFVQIKTDTFFNSKQIISIVAISQNSRDKFSLNFAYNRSALQPTSSFAQEANALAAINGGFFNMDSGGNVTYFEVNDSVISRRRMPKLKWGIEDSIMTGAIVIKDDFDVVIEPVKSAAYYEASQAESAVLVTGPLLLLQSQKKKLPNMKFTNNRHPRTCLCESEASIALITIDGRSAQAAGMSLQELQSFLLDIGCIDAINFDGGGSTTMWLQEVGIVNNPSDKTGERPVANTLLIMKK